jgi:hypothetical protein
VPREEREVPGHEHHHRRGKDKKVSPGEHEPPRTRGWRGGS